MRYPAITVIHPEAGPWDTFVDQHPEGHLLQQSRWAAVKQTTGWECLRIGICDDGVLLAGAQILIKKRYGLAAWYIPRGPVLADDQLLNQALLAALRSQAQQQRAVFVRMEPNMVVGSIRERIVTRLLASAGLQTSESTQPQHSVQVDLEPTVDALLAAMTKGHRADIKKAQKLGVTIRVGTTDADLDVFVGLMQETGARAGFAVHSKAYYAEVWERFRQKQRALLLIAEYNGASVAAAMIVASGQTACYLYGGSNAEAFQCAANHLIQWHAIQWAKELGCSAYDLWGIPQRTDLPDSPSEAPAEMAGLIRFKKGFGGTEVSFYPAYTDVLLPLIYRFAARRLTL
ncbi:MAG: hypothetical protein RLY87_1607 [Chloroflexota bacterium]|jgi:lipid II:glycine glycyltransferase (peptidoglycan interpeptide bridge formation enzyme)